MEKRVLRRRTVSIISSSCTYNKADFIEGHGLTCYKPVIGFGGIYANGIWSSFRHLDRLQTSHGRK